MVKKDSLIGAQKRPLHSLWRIPMAQWIGQEWLFKKKPNWFLIKKFSITQSVFHTVISRI